MGDQGIKEGAALHARNSHPPLETAGAGGVPRGQNRSVEIGRRCGDFGCAYLAVGAFSSGASGGKYESGLAPTKMTTRSGGTTKPPRVVLENSALIGYHLTPSNLGARGGPKERSNKSNSAFIGGGIASIGMSPPESDRVVSRVTMVTPSPIKPIGTVEISSASQWPYRSKTNLISPASLTASQSGTTSINACWLGCFANSSSQGHRSPSTSLRGTKAIPILRFWRFNSSVALLAVAVSLLSLCISSSLSWACLSRNGLSDDSFSQCAPINQISPAKNAATKTPQISANKSMLWREDSNAATLASTATLSIGDSDDDTFFYAFTGLTVFFGLIGLIWPSFILVSRLRKRK
jgi:hypothetical protein